MAKTAQEITDAIYDNINDKTKYSSHYIGITNKFVRRLFREHNVPRKDVVINKKHVRAVEKHFLNKRMKGDTGEETDDSI